MKTLVNVHLVARALEPPVALHHHALASWLWPRLQAAFPDALATVLMPNHLHLLTPTPDPDAARETLARIVGNLARTKGPARQTFWQPVPAADIITDRKKLLRVARYVPLNPVRAGLVTDALAWPWSTQRDVVGAVARPWVSADHLARALGCDDRDFVAWWHRYVSTDSLAGPCVPLGEPAFCRLAKAPLEWIAEAAASATRGTVADIRRQGPTRHLFLALAMASGWDWSSRLAEACNITPRAVRYSLLKEDAAALQAGLRCLADARLRVASRSAFRVASEKRQSFREW